MDDSSNPSALLVELIRLNSRYADSFQAFLQARSELVARLDELDPQFIALADQYRGDDRPNVDPELRCVAGDLVPRLRNDDLERAFAELAECFARKLKYLALACQQ